jgi:pyruvate formate lyase activating enzyme
MNIDLKAYNDRFYKSIGGSLAEVKQVIEHAAKKCHVEITTLVIPGENDDPGEIERMAQWIAGINSDIPLHLTRFFPNYKMADKEPTPIAKLNQLLECAGKHLNYVYLGNV